MKYILFAQNDVLLTRFDSDVHGDRIPADAMKVSEQLFYRTICELDGLWMLNRDSGQISKTPFPPPSAEQALAGLLDAGRAHMDARAAAAGFKDISDAVSYANEDAVPHLQAEAKAFRGWRSLVMERWREVSAAVQSGGVTPAVDIFIQSLPEFTLVRVS